MVFHETSTTVCNANNHTFFIETTVFQHATEVLYVVPFTMSHKVLERCEPKVWEAPNYETNLISLINLVILQNALHPRFLAYNP